MRRLHFLELVPGGTRVSVWPASQTSLRGCTLVCTARPVEACALVNGTYKPPPFPGVLLKLVVLCVAAVTIGIFREAEEGNSLEICLASRTPQRQDGRGCSPAPLRSEECSACDVRRSMGDRRH